MNSIGSSHGDGRISSYKIITSGERLDANFMSNYNDLRSELSNKGIQIEMKVMKPEDVGSQHERFVLTGAPPSDPPVQHHVNKKAST